MTTDGRETPLTEYVPGQVWLKRYPVDYAGCTLFARLTVVRLAGGGLWAHSPSPIDDDLLDDLAALGPVAHIVAPGSYHYFHVPAWQAAFPRAETWICPGIERKRPELAFDWCLGNRPPPAWAGEIDQHLVRGNRLIWEVAFHHRPSRTLILTDLVENIGDATPGTNWVLVLWWKGVMRMWNVPKPAPEYQLGWSDKSAARRSLERILEWDFERVVLAHGENIETNAKQIVRTAWRRPLGAR